MRIDVVIPTVTGREHLLDRAVRCLKTRSTHQVTIAVVKDRPGAGIAWNEGARALDGSRGDYLHLHSDDLQAWPGWDVAAIEAVERGFYPSCEIMHTPGVIFEWGRSQTPIPPWTRVESGVLPFMSWEMWDRIGPTLECHYYTDDFLSWRAEMEGFPNVYAPGYAFVHGEATAGRRWNGATQGEKMVRDKAIFDAAKEQWLREQHA
jgi:hypothetical protein